MKQIYLSRLQRAGISALVLVTLLVLGAAYQATSARGSASLAATPTPAPEQPVEEPAFQPFPNTTTITETIRAVLEAYKLGNSKQELSLAATSFDPFGGGNTYLPVAQKAPSGSDAPDPTMPTPRPRLPKSADVAVTIWAAPSIRVARAGTLEYQVRVKNYGHGIAQSTTVDLPYNKQQVQVRDSRFSRAGDWISELNDDTVAATFGPIAAGESASGTIVFHVGANLPNDTVLSVRATYSWSDSARDGEGRSNWAPVLVGGGNDSAPWAWAIVSPTAGAAGTTHRFFSDRFIPNEGIITWLNTPTGVRPLELRGLADGMGRAYLDFKSTGLAPGTYQLVLYGARSDLTGVATFNVR
jgi:hypothetical protein